MAQTKVKKMSHPATENALFYIMNRTDLDEWMEHFYSHGDAVSVWCRATLDCIMSDDMNKIDSEEILGLAWVMKQGECG